MYDQDGNEVYQVFENGKLLTIDAASGQVIEQETLADGDCR